MFIDSHAHLTAKEFDNDRDAVLGRAVDAGVGIIINPGTDLDDSRRAVVLTQHSPAVYAGVGVHPHQAKGARDETFLSIEELSTEPKVVAIGEIGLDYHYDFSPRDVQVRVFRAQLEIAARRGLPVIIHTRDSLDQTISIVEEFATEHPAWGSRFSPANGRFPALRGVFHCFPGDVAAAWRVIKLGFCVSLPGVVTFKNAGEAARVGAEISPEHLLLETDSPYLAPVPYRGSRNEPAHVTRVASRIAELQHLSVEDIARTTAYSAYTLFGVGNPPAPVFTYRLRDSLYINLTIRCNADCVFCDRKGEAIIKGHSLRIEREPTAREVIQEIGDPAKFDEIVFCGYGEPTIRLPELKEVARWAKAHGGKTRLNTDGHGSVINKRNIVPELVGVIDAVSISLNSPDPVQYGELMRIDGPRFFAAMLEFAKECVRLLPNVVMTIVNLDEVEQEKARRLVEDEIGATFVTRPYF